MKTTGLSAVLVLALLACKSGSKPKDEPAPVTGSVAAVATTAFDERKATKRAGDLEFVFGNAELGAPESGKKVALVAFLVRNKSSKEKLVSSSLMFQAKTPDGEVGELDILKSKCTGTIEPNGNFACVLKYDFIAAPTELRVRAADGLDDGIWFRVKVVPARP
jgi:hypothetical protein